MSALDRFSAAFWSAMGVVAALLVLALGLVLIAALVDWWRARQIEPIEDAPDDGGGEVVPLSIERAA